jgi:hypothetical protein
MSGKRLAIVGSRYLRSYKAVCSVIKKWIEQHGNPSRIVTGDCRGADAIGAKWAQRHDTGCDIHIAKWTIDGKYDKSAGWKRNKLIVEESDFVIAIVVDGLPYKGTSLTIKLAQDTAKPVWLCTFNRERRTLTIRYKKTMSATKAQQYANM